MLKTTLSAIALILAGSAAGCGSPVSGTYRDANGFLVIRFAPPHTAYIKTAGDGETTARYEINGDHVVLRSSGGEVVLTLKADGTLAGSPAGPLIKSGR